MGPKGEQENVTWLCEVHGYLKAHQTEHSTCTRPHTIILQQGHVMLKGERGEREGESQGEAPAGWTP